jgi:hypothetical protein
MDAESTFEGIAAGDKFWFQYSFYSDSMFAVSRESVVPRIRQDMSGQKTMITIFFAHTGLLVLETVRKGTKFNQDNLIHAIFPRLHNEKTRISSKKIIAILSVPMEKSMCQNSHKVFEKFAQRTIERAPHPPYSPDISPCDFWLFGVLRPNMKDREFQSQQAILNAIT